MENYTVVKYLGDGKYSCVHHCRENSTNKDVTIHMCSKSHRPHFLGLMKLIPKEHTCNLITYFEWEGNHYYVFDYIDGKDLNEYPHKLSEMDILQMTREILGVLDKIHNTGIVHSDIKQENILYDGTKFYLIDFNLAYYIDDPPQFSQRGTWELASPELVRHYRRRVDLYEGNPTNDWDEFSAKDHAIPSEIWTLGITIYELAKDIQLEQPLEEYVDHVKSPKIHKLLCHMLAIDFHQRPTAKELLEMIDTL